MEDKTQQLGMPGNSTADTTRQMNQTMITGVGLANPAMMQTAMGVPVRALDIETIAGGSHSPAALASRMHLLLMLKASGNIMGRRMPLNLCLCIDRSGSMEGEPLDFVKRACSYVVDLLDNTDILSIVTFEEHVDVVMPARRIVNKALIKEHIQRIQPGNTTNLYDGLQASCIQVASVQIPGYLNRVLVLTDGEPTTGIKEFNSIVSMIAEQKARGISVTALGFGGDYNEELMAGIARRSGGNYYYIAQPSLIPEVFRSELETLMTTTARNVMVRIRTPRGIQPRYIYGVSSPRISQRMVEYPLPDVERGSVISSLVEVDLDRHAPGTYRIALVEVTYEDIVTKKQETLTSEAVIVFTNDQDEVERGKNPMVQMELETHLASRDLEKTMMGMRTQQLTTMGALSELQKTRNILANAGKTEEAQEVTRAIDALRTGGSDAEKTLIGTIYNLDQGKKKK